MSHFTTLSKANIKDPKAFIAAAKELGFNVFKENVSMRGYAGNKMKVDVAASHPKCEYDVGIKKNGDKYDLIADWWGVRHAVPNAEDAFVQLTTKHTILNRYRAQGFLARTTTDKNRNIVVTLTR